MPGSSRRAARVALMCVVLALLGGGCISVNRSRSGTDPTPAPAGSPVPVPTDESGTSLDDGRHFGYIKAMDPGSRTLVFDLAEFLTGDEADRAAADDGEIQPDEDVPNDYYIRNNNTRLRTLAYAPDVAIRIVNRPDCCESIDGDLEKFVNAFRPNEGDDLYKGPDSQYWLTVSGESIVKIEEQYLP